MRIESINSKEDLDIAFKRIDELWDAEPNTPEGDELDTLVSLVEDYELSKIVLAKEQ